MYCCFRIYLLIRCCLGGGGKQNRKIDGNVIMLYGKTVKDLQQQYNDTEGAENKAGMDYEALKRQIMETKTGSELNLRGNQSFETGKELMAKERAL